MPINQIPQQAQPQPAQPQPAQPQPAQPQPAQPQPAQPQSAYDSIITQQQAQIEALINANANLTQQVTQMVQNGAQFYQPQSAQQVTHMPTNMVPLQDNEDYSIEALAKEIGKRDDFPPKNA